MSKKFKNLQEIDETFIGTINECRSHFSSTIIKLFENHKFDDDFKPKSAIKFDDYYGNKFAYFNAVGKLFESVADFKKSMLFEHNDFNNFKAELKDEIDKLFRIDDFIKLQTVDKLILQTRIFSGNALNIYGFDIQQFNKILERNKFKGCFMVIYCKSTKMLFMVAENELFTYSIKTNDIEIIKLNVKLNINNAVKYINENYSNNIVIINTLLPAEPETVDNLFSDKRLQEGYRKRMTHLNFNSLVKK